MCLHFYSHEQFIHNFDTNVQQLIQKLNNTIKGLNRQTLSVEINKTCLN